MLISSGGFVFKKEVEETVTCSFQSGENLKLIFRKMAMELFGPL